MKVRVTESQLDKLRAQGTPTKAIAKYKNDASMREALNRFYGKDRVAKAIGSTPPAKKKTTPPVKKTTPPKKKTGTPVVVKGSQRTNATRGPFGAPGQIQRKTSQVRNSNARGMTEEGKKKSSQAFDTALTIASFLPWTAAAARTVKIGMVARKFDITRKEAKAVMAAAKTVKKGKPLAIGSGKTKAGNAARHVKPKGTAARRTKPTVRSTVKDVKGVVKRSAGTHAKPNGPGRHAASSTLRGTVTRTTSSTAKRAAAKARNARSRRGRRG